MPLATPAADVWTLLAEWAEQGPDAPALLHGERTISFSQLHEQSLRAARGLADLGVGPGDRVALWLPNIPAYPILYFACARLGAIAVAVNTRFRAVEVADIVGRCGFDQQLVSSATAYDLGSPQSHDYAFQMNCNTPFEVRVKSDNGAMAYDGQHPDDGFAYAKPYTVGLSIGTDQGLLHPADCDAS